jgi:hypothetical protein
MHQVGMVTVEAESGIGGATDLLRLSPDRDPTFLRPLRNPSGAAPMPRRDRCRNA